MNEFLSQWLVTIIAMIITGAFAGILAGLLGVGGGIVIVPVLYFVLQAMDVSPATAMLVATATSLLTIVPTSISSIPIADHLPGMKGQGAMAGFIGFFSVIMGVGGGTIGVPLLNACNYSPHRAVGTASVFGMLIAVPGSRPTRNTRIMYIMLIRTPSISMSTVST